MSTSRFLTFKNLKRMFMFTASTYMAVTPPADVTILTADRLLDPRSGNVLSPAAVLIENGKIKEVGAPAKVQALSGAKVVDLGNATVLPGLIDSHTHLLVDPITPAEAERARHYNGA